MERQKILKKAVVWREYDKDDLNKEFRLSFYDDGTAEFEIMFHDGVINDVGFEEIGNVSTVHLSRSDLSLLYDELREAKFQNHLYD